jgi:hypothetical protein
MMRAMTKTEFAKNRDEEDEDKLENMKGGAIRALSNYLLYESSAKDDKLVKAMNSFSDNNTKNKRVDNKQAEIKAEQKCAIPHNLNFPPKKENT